MSHKHQYLVYYIHLTDKALYDSLALTGSPDTIGAVLAAPDHVATNMGIPKLAKTAPFVAPSITSEWFGTEDHFPTNVDAFDRCSGGWFGICFLFGDTTTYHWRGIYTYDAPIAPPGVPVPLNISRRRWIDGFEIQEAQSSNVGAEGSIGNAGGFLSRMASRHVDGLGWALRSEGSITRRHTTTENIAGQPDRLWERFYLRPRVYPLGVTRIWETFWNGASTGYVLEISPSGQLGGGWKNAAGTLTQVGTSVALPLDVWKRIDIVHYGRNTPFGEGDFTLWINGVVAFQFTVPPPPPPGTNIGPARGTIQESRIGTNGANSLSIDIDDWIAADNLLGGGVDGADFQAGSRVVLVNATGFDASMAGWTGDWRWCLMSPIQNADTSLLASSTNGAVLAVTTDCSDSVDSLPESMGAAAVLVQAQLSGGNVADTIAQTGGLAAAGVVSAVAGDWKLKFSSISGTPTPIKPLGPMLLKYTKASVAAQTMRHLSATVELIGTFGPEDLPNLVPAPSVMPANTGPHNAPYPRTPWARLTTAPIQPVFLRQGTYTGNGTAQDLAFPLPIHLLFIRPASGGNGGVHWWSSMLSAHKNMTDGVLANLMPQALADVSFVPGGVDTQQTQYLCRLVGANANNNQNGIVYQYLAVGDPGQRFIVAGGLKSPIGALDSITRLINTGFTALAALFQPENGTSVGNVMYFKGPGNAIDSVSNVASGSGEVAAAIQFGAGQLTSKSAFHAFVNVAPTCPFLLFRVDDNSSDDVGSNRGKVFRVVTYVGDGNASRTIALTPNVGKRPLWVLVIPTNGAQAYYKDAGNTATGVMQASNGTITVGGITGGGIDTISVDVSLNANGVVYQILEFPGSATAGSGGFSVPGDFWPVPPDPPPGAPGPADGPEPGDPPADVVIPPAVVPDPPASTGPMPGLTDDLAIPCEPATRAMCNDALSRIGISTQIADVAVDLTTEASAVRLLYNEAIQETLRDFPWPFATRYAQLTRVGTTRPNSDWLYSYRQPSDCILERRIVISRTDVANPDAIPFQLSSDYDPDGVPDPTGGGLIFCNLSPAVLEYTARPKCPHTRSEPLFRDAATWRLAGKLAPSLTRLPEKVKACREEYDACIARAYAVLRPGNAGEMPAAATIDTSAAAKAANLSVINLALVQIGAPTIVNLATDQSRSAQIARMIFEQELQGVLRDFPWPFATAYATPALVAGTATVPVNLDWQYSYRLPADTVFVRRLVDESGRAYARLPFPYRVARDGTGGLLLTSQTPANIEYTARLEGAVLAADAIFRDALAWRLSWKMAPSLAQVVPDRPEAVGRGPDETALQGKDRPATGNQLRARAASTARECYYFALQTARATSASESQTDLAPTNADWIDGRDFGTIGDGDGPLGLRRWR